MTAIKVNNLKKTFKTKVKEEGFKGSIKGVFSPKYKEVKAVDDISFEIKKGEIVGFIGPNGAGKSTTIKMLTGILYPTSGEISVLGKIPWKERKKLAYELGTVFGQRSQLWLHLPARDSFELFGVIYKMDKKKYLRRVKELAKEFEIEDLLDVPVRKLSLGQRMRAELVAALLHQPDVLYLDEPTIGLDIIAKKRMREHIKRINEKEGVTVIFTSHDMDDIEDVCQRIMVINHGKIVHDSSVEDMRSKYLQKKMITVHHSEGEKPFQLKGVKLVSQAPFATVYEVDKREQKVREVIVKLTKYYALDDLEISDPPIEEILEDIFARKQ